MPAPVSLPGITVIRTDRSSGDSEPPADTPLGLSIELQNKTFNQNVKTSTLSAMLGLRLFVAGLFTLAFVAQAQDPYKASGYITVVQASGDFDVEGMHIHLTPTTQFCAHTATSSTTPASKPAAFYLGEPLDAIGHLDHATRTLTATQIILVPPSSAKVSGTAIIDLIPPAPTAQSATDLSVRADGFLLHITTKTNLNFAAPLNSISDIATNQWIDYSGVQQLDGTVLLDHAGIGPNKINHTEDKFRTRTDYDPGAVPDDAHQSGLSKAFKGIDARKIPPYHNQDMQTRVERIGNSLIPAYQRALPDSDPGKIHFRFQVIDSTKWRDAVNMPSGVIVVPRQVVERMKNDDQLATVLADNIAEVIEKDALRTHSVSNKVLAADLAGDAVNIIVPFAGLATDLAGGGVAAHVHSLELQQSGRVSLCFLHNAGYDITQAPLAWWLLAPKSAKPVDDITLPSRALTLYIALGTTWHPALDPAKLPLDKNVPDPCEK